MLNSWLLVKITPNVMYVKLNKLKHYSMKKLTNYLFPNDWVDKDVIEIYHHSSVTGTKEALSRKIIIQKSPSTGRYRKQVINIYP